MFTLFGNGDGSVGSVNETVGSINETVGSVNETVGSLNETVGSINGSVGSVNETVGSLNETVGSINGSVGSVNETVGSLNETVGSINECGASANGNDRYECLIMCGGVKWGCEYLLGKFHIPPAHVHQLCSALYDVCIDLCDRISSVTEDFEVSVLESLTILNF
jgi:uncharacterized protein YjbJ (UPF0337 family)